jgi:hypothetical protein
MPPKCAKCKSSHPPPRGNRCQFSTPAASQTDDTLAKLSSTLTELSDRIARLEASDDEVQVRASTTKNARERLQALRLLATDTADSAPSDADESADSDADTRRKAKKSGKLRTSSHKVKFEVDWPHFYVTRDDSPATYDTLSMAEFCYGFICMLEHAPITQRPHMQAHLKDLMEDAMSHQWQSVRAYHATVLNHIETGRITWATACNERLRRLHVWNRPQQSKKPHPSLRQPDNSRQITACKDYQAGSCSLGAIHDGKHHICAYCFNKGGYTNAHPESECRRKDYTSSSKNGNTEGK